MALNTKIIASVAANVRRLRKAMKLSQEELGFESGLHRTYISQIECRERNISINAIEKLAKALKVRAGEIVDPPPKKTTVTKR
jgi:transcriptional regulator with XRE-family HTH domain